jgi:hypothetical protein
MVVSEGIRQLVGSLRRKVSYLMMSSARRDAASSPLATLVLIIF